MKRLTKLELENISEINFAIAILNDYGKTLNPYSPLSKKIAETIHYLRQIREAQDEKADTTNH